MYVLHIEAYVELDPIENNETVLNIDNGPLYMIASEKSRISPK